MIEIRYTKEEVTLKTDLQDCTVDNVLSILDKVKEFPITTEVLVHDNVPVGTDATLTPDIHSREYIRDRLPNDTTDKENVVDLDKVSLEKPVSTKHTNFRCSDCGQSVLAVVNDTIVMRDLESKVDNLCIVTGIDLNQFSYEEAKQHVTDVGVSLVADANTKAHCPMCSSEKHIELWAKAYNSPLLYFDYETPCPICGGETAYHIGSAGTSVLKCDKTECGYELKEC